METGVPAGSARDLHTPTQAPICHCFPELQSYRRAGPLSREAAGCQRSCPDGRWSWPGTGGGSGQGPVPESSAGAGEAERPPGGSSASPTPCWSRGQIRPQGDPFQLPRLCSRFLPDGAGSRARARDFGTGTAGGLTLRPWGSDPRGERCTAGTHHRRAGGLAAGEEGADDQGRGLRRGGDLGRK